jgi:serine/threonine protein kinase
LYVFLNISSCFAVSFLLALAFCCSVVSLLSASFSAPASLPDALFVARHVERYIIIDQDWWSMGILLFELLTGHVPFHSVNRQELYAQTVAGEIPFPAYVSKEAQSLIRGVLGTRFVCKTKTCFQV